MRKLREDEIEARWTDNRSPHRHPIVVVLEDVRSAYNVGAIVRTADAADLERIIVCGITATPDHRKVHKTALGAQQSIPWEEANAAPEVLKRLRDCGYTIAALEITDTPTRASELSSSDFPLCLVVGNEVKGVSKDSLELCDLAIELPQYGAKHSLNAAVAFGIAAYGLMERYRDLHRTIVVGHNPPGLNPTQSVQDKI